MYEWDRLKKSWERNGLLISDDSLSLPVVELDYIAGTYGHIEMEIVFVINHLSCKDHFKEKPLSWHANVLITFNWSSRLERVAIQI